MKRAGLSLCALGGALLLVAGCAAIDLDLDIGGVPVVAHSRVIEGTPDNVAVVLRDTLKKRGLEATIVKGKDDILVESKTPGGLQFALLLKSRQSPSGKEETTVALEWMGGRDSVAEGQIVAELERHSKK